MRKASKVKPYILALCDLCGKPLRSLRLMDLNYLFTGFLFLL